MGNSARDRCDRDFYEIVHLRDGCCQSCGMPGGEAHRIFMKSQRPPADVRFDPDYAVMLCPAGHRGDMSGRCDPATAPHVSPERFKVEVLPRLLNNMGPVRAHKIRSQIDKIWTRSMEKPDYVAIRSKLKAEIAKYETKWMDADCEFRPAG